MAMVAERASASSYGGALAAAAAMAAEAMMLPAPSSSPQHHHSAPDIDISAHTSSHLRSLSAPCSGAELTLQDQLPEYSGQLREHSRDPTELFGRRMALELQVAGLQKRLASERAVRRALETATVAAFPSPSCAIVYSPPTVHSQQRLTTRQARELIHEISCLEGEVTDLEQHVLWLYRHFFDRSIANNSMLWKQAHLRQSSNAETAGRQCQAQAYESRWRDKIVPLDDDEKPARKKDISDNMSMVWKQLQQQSYESRCRSISMSQQTTASANTATRLTSSSSSSVTPHSDISNGRSNSSWRQTSSSVTPIAPSSHVQSHRSTSSKLTKHGADKALKIKSISEGGSKPLREYLQNSPNKLSEELVRCMAAIYCKLAEPPLQGHLVTGLPESPPSSSSCTSSSTSISSIHGLFSDGWSPRRRTESSLLQDSRLQDPYQVKGDSGRHIGAYSRMVEVPWICVDKERLGSVSNMLREFRSMVEQLEKLDPSQLKHDEKLAFWINIYNALLMHAYLAYGIPRNNLKRMTLLQRAAYKVGGYSINAHTIEHFILRCRSHRPTQWLPNLLLPGSKFKTNDEKRTYAISNPEPLVCFALCCGGQSDPAVRVYTAKNVRGELEAAKREYFQASIGFQNEKKVLMPKILEWYAREASISCNTLLEWVSQYMDVERECCSKEGTQRRSTKAQKKSSNYRIEWMSYNFSFRYIFDRDLMVDRY